MAPSNGGDELDPVVRNWVYIMNGDWDTIHDITESTAPSVVELLLRDEI